MPKLQRTLSLDYDIWFEAKKAGLNVSAIAESALRQELANRNKSNDAERIKDAWEAQGKLAEQKEYGKQLKEVQELEKKLVEENRDVWNETYRILKEANTLPLDVVQRIKKRAILFKELKEAKE